MWRAWQTRSVSLPYWPASTNIYDVPTVYLFILLKSKIMLKILQARLQQYENCELPDVQAEFRKGRGTRDQIANICWIIEKAREFQKNIYFCFIDYAKAFVWITINCGKFLKRWEYQTTWPASWEICMQVKKQPLEFCMEQQIGSKSGKEYLIILSLLQMTTFLFLGLTGYWAQELVLSNTKRKKKMQLSNTKTGKGY